MREYKIKGVINNFIKNQSEEDAIKYDFSAEKAVEEYCDASSIKKYIIYNSYTIGSMGNEFLDGKRLCQNICNKYGKKEENGRRYSKFILDPDDQSVMLQDIYRKLWPDLFKEGDKKIYSDTMTSVKNTMNFYFEKLIENKVEREKRISMGQKENSQKGSISYIIDIWGKGQPQVNSDLDKCLDKAVERLSKGIKDEEKLEKFLGAWHTLGNYCPVPRGFNVPRSNTGRYDFWDLTLMKIKEWYESVDSKSEYERDSLIRNDLFHNDPRGDVLSCVNWLKQFGTGKIGWKHFIDYFYLQNWVNSDYEVEPLWDNHGWISPNFPDELEEDGLIEFFEKYFDEYARRINERTKKMFRALKA